MVTLKEFDDFVDALATHNWHYDCAADKRVWLKGVEATKLLDKKTANETVLNIAYSTYSKSIMDTSGSLLKRITSRNEVLEQLRDHVCNQIKVVA